MKASLILRTAARPIQPLMLLAAVLILLGGHQEPGGGFVGGLVASAAFTLQALAFDAGAARRTLRASPASLVAAGLAIATAAAALPLLLGRPVFEILWITAQLGVLGTVHAGTSLVFDAGVFLVVLGGSTLVVFTFLEESVP